ncbi:hypothetical protein GPOL_c33760 [Gordonia polyisoprenivorans VH2]|uniref:ATP-binding protein n=2 Tax=Gordonia polyisoprenivorans TaxID=84595 RepID=H6MZ52_GORPV|nr:MULTISPECIES: DUF3107 domain-containing protein [Gordonia]AFA74388.1 hypothetical protein GPOL_c33760 [Gordonia polyisoprenivorans VH2]MDF3282448.1 DUF3107 domain-containing protein [Gordonia sp. N1V]NKY05218.1 DUF3107 domain-containing protein [Gordonia polyisoprenivorans]OPX14125.1 ATP-binding protein [Gordonia sp. i37]OZC31419.1 DUF3107 domain-containing protein [Gordonia polyisoprenivorans]
MTIEVKIGITDSPRELSIQSPLESDKAFAAVEAVLTGKEPLLSLTDDRGARYLVPAAKIAYVEVGAAENRRVGFGS